MQKYLFVALSVVLGFVSAATAITPPTITQPKPGLLRFIWTAPTTRQNGAPMSASEIGGYRLYLTNETAVITIPAGQNGYDYAVPVGYTTKSTDGAAISTVDIDGVEGPSSAPILLPVGITSPKPLPGAPTSLKAVAQ